MQELKREIDVGELDPEFKYEITREPGAEDVMACFACGTCTAGCPVQAIDEAYNPRRIIRMALLGMREHVLRSEFIWLCSSCYTCEERCPQGVKIPEVMNALKNIAAREGYVHPAYVQQLNLIRVQGRLYEIDDFDNRKRERLGLPPIHMESDELEEIFRITGLDELLEIGV